MKKFLSSLLTLCMVLSVLCTGAAFAASDAVQEDAAALTVDDILTVPTWDGNRLIDNLDLDVVTQGEVNASPITWSSTNEAVISTSGIVTRGAEDAEVTVIATIGTDDDTITKDFTFVVPAASKNINGMPNVTSVKYEDTFSDASINTSKISSGALAEKIVDGETVKIDTVEEASGKLTLTRSEWTSGEPYIEFGHEFNGNSITAAEFTLHSTSAYVRIPFIGYNWNGYPLYIHWYPNNNQISIGNRQTQDVNYRIKLPASAKGKKAKFTAVFNHPKATYDLWVNNELVVNSGAYGLQSNGKPAQKPYKFRIVTLTNSWMDGVGSIAMDNLKIYECTKSDALATIESLESTLANLNTYTSNGKVYINDDFINFNEVTGVNGATVSYDISDTTAITENGDVVRALTDKPVTISATVTAGGETLTKSYNYVVPGKYNRVADGNLPAMGDIIYEDAFNGNEVTATLYQNTAQSVTQANGMLTMEESSGSAEKGVSIKHPAVTTGVLVQDFVFDSTSAWLRIGILNDWHGASYRIHYHANNQKLQATVTSGTHEYSETLSGKIRLTVVTDTVNSLASIYVNGNEFIKDEPYTISGGRKNVLYLRLDHMCATQTIDGVGQYYWGVGTTNLYDYKVYRIASEDLPSIMAAEPTYSNGGTVAAGDNTVTLPVVATDDEGAASKAKLAYAIYSVENGTKKLVGVDVEDLGLDKYSHKEYTLSVKLASVPENAEQKLFYWGVNGLTPITTGAFPAQ